jgi:hypothetical protein
MAVVPHRASIPGIAGAVLRCVVPALALLLVAGCTEETVIQGAPPLTRSYALGFGYFPHDGTSAGVLAALDVIENDADMLVAHFDGGIPWDAALANDFDAYPQNLRDEVTFISAARPAGHEVYLAITPIAFLRDRLAPTLTASGPVFQAPWDARRFDHPDVITAYRNHCHIMINAFQPDYMAFGVEVNLFALLVEDSLYESYRNLADSVYADLKASYPALPVFQTIQADAYYADTAAQRTAIEQILPTTDYVAVSAYPYANAARYPDGSRADPALLPATFFSEVRDLAPSKPFAIAETGWPAEDIGAPYPIELISGTLYQQQYVKFALDEADRLDGRFVSILISRDYDAFWESTLKNDPNAATLRLWKDIGLYDGAGVGRPALADWRSRLSRERR